MTVTKYRDYLQLVGTKSKLSYSSTAREPSVVMAFPFTPFGGNEIDVVLTGSLSPEARMDVELKNDHGLRFLVAWKEVGGGKWRSHPIVLPPVTFMASLLLGADGSGTATIYAGFQMEVREFSRNPMWPSP